MPEIPTEETTNKVLETKIEGLIKLTDERFENLKETLGRMEAANLVTIASFNEKEKAQDLKIEELTASKLILQGQISSLKLLGGILAVIITIAEFVIGHYWH